jgi:hypothetical protein
VKKKQTQKTLNLEYYKEYIREALVLKSCHSAIHVNENAKTITTWLEFAVESSTTLKTASKESPWWNEELSWMQGELKNLNRQIRRCKDTDRVTGMTEAKAALRRKYNAEIFASKERAWKDFITRDQPWGMPYKLNTKPRNRCDGIPPIQRTDGIEATNDKEASEIILSEKFPRSILSMPYQRPRGSGS